MDLNELKELLGILEERQIAEFELEESGKKLRIRRVAAAPPWSPPAGGASSPRSVPAPVEGGPPAAQPPVQATEASVGSGLVVVKSPIVGTFFRAPDPNSPPFVSVGGVVKVGQVLCIIEAMKLMNEIEAELAGEIVKVHPENGQPVQYGEALFSIRPTQ